MQNEHTQTEQIQTRTWQCTHNTRSKLKEHMGYTGYFSVTNVRFAIWTNNSKDILKKSGNNKHTVTHHLPNGRQTHSKIAWKVLVHDKHM
jgi:hypothetical protein